MPEPSLSLQAAVRARLIASPDLSELVPASAIFDRHTRPTLDRMIVLGTGNTLFADQYESFADRVVLDLHVWVREDSFSTCKRIAYAMHQALRAVPWEVEGYIVHAADLSARYVRDPKGEYAHGSLILTATMKATA